MLRSILTCSLLLFLVSVGTGAETEPPLDRVMSELGIQVDLSKEIHVDGPSQGLFVKVEPKVELVLVAKYSFGVEPATSNVRAGYYPFSSEPDLRPVFTCGLKAGDQSQISGLPTTPDCPHFFDPGSGPFGLFVQSANFNPGFTYAKETVYTQDRLNSRIERFGMDIHKAKIYPYQTRWGVKPNWYVVCWEFSTNNDYQDIITVIRGVKLIKPPHKPKKAGDLKDAIAMIPNR